MQDRVVYRGRLNVQSTPSVVAERVVFQWTLMRGVTRFPFVMVSTLLKPEETLPVSDNDEEGQ